MIRLDPSFSVISAMQRSADHMLLKGGVKSSIARNVRSFCACIAVRDRSRLATNAMYPFAWGKKLKIVASYCFTTRSSQTNPLSSPRFSCDPVTACNHCFVATCMGCYDPIINFCFDCFDKACLDCVMMQTCFTCFKTSCCDPMEMCYECCLTFCDNCGVHSCR